MTWRTVGHRQQRDSTRFWTIVQMVIYFVCFSAAAWLIMTGIEALAGPVLCGNGVVDPGEDCLTCPEDVPCKFCEQCLSGLCEPNPFCSCGDGVPSPGETCANCPNDVQCLEGEICVEGRCVVECIAKVSPMEVIFLFDTSGSMIDEAADLCAALDGIQASLEAFGLDVTIKVWGIAPGISIACLTEYVYQYGPIQNESWAYAVTLMAPNYPGPPGARILVPISDEGPFWGNPCDYGDDKDAIHEAIIVANENNVIVSVIMGTVWQKNTEECIQSFGRQLAFGTGGTWHHTTGVDMQDLVLGLIQATLCGCAGDLDNDGTVGILDLLLLLSYWGLADGDIDNDGDTDALDLLLLLQNWGGC